MTPGRLDPAINAELDRIDIKADAVIPMDPNITQYDLEGKSLLDLPDSSPAVEAVDSFMKQVLSRAKK